MACFSRGLQSPNASCCNYGICQDGYQTYWPPCYVYTCYMAYSILLPPPRRLRLQPCLAVCLLTGLLKKLLHQIFVKLHPMVGHNQETNELRF